MNGLMQILGFDWLSYMVSYWLKDIQKRQITGKAELFRGKEKNKTKKKNEQKLLSVQEKKNLSLSNLNFYNALVILASSFSTITS